MSAQPSVYGAPAVAFLENVINDSSSLFSAVPDNVIKAYEDIGGSPFWMRAKQHVEFFQVWHAPNHLQKISAAFESLLKQVLSCGCPDPSEIGD